MTRKHPWVLQQILPLDFFQACEWVLRAHDDRQLVIDQVFFI